MLASDPILSADDLRQLLRYEPDTGKLFWLPRTENNYLHLTPARRKTALGRFKAQQEGNEAGVRDRRYLRVYVGGKEVYAHRVIWCIVTGNWPVEQIDHMDGDGCNNRLENLREVTPLQNARNQSRRADNKSGISGVHWQSHSHKWRAVIQGADYCDLGLFDNLGDARAAIIRKRAEIGSYSHRHGKVDRVNPPVGRPSPSAKAVLCSRYQERALNRLGD